MSEPRKIELQVAGIAAGSGRAEYSVLKLKEARGSRELAIRIGTSEAQSIVVEMSGVCPPRPLTHQLFAGVLEAMGVQLLGMLIYKVENEIYYSYIYLKAGNAIMRADARTSDAVALALRMRAPVLANESVLSDARPSLGALAGMDEKALREESVDRLRVALRQAVETENYEIAARLRDAINGHGKRP